MDVFCHARDFDNAGTFARHERGIRPRVLLAHRQPVVLEGLRSIAERAGFQVIGLAEGSSAFSSASESLTPDLIVLESGMNEARENDVAPAIRRRNPQVAVLFLGTPTDDRLKDALHRSSGFACFVSKSASAAELGTAMRQAIERRSFSHGAEQSAPSPSLGEPRLTPRQVEVLRLVAEGKTAKQIAGALNISSRTAEFHKLRVMETLNLRSTAELTRYAIEHKIYDLYLPAPEFRSDDPQYSQA